MFEGTFRLLVKVLSLFSVLELLFFHHVLDVKIYDCANRISIFNFTFSSLLIFVVF